MRRLAGLARRPRDERGATAAEYALLMSFIALIILAGIGAFGIAVDAWFSRMAAAVDAVL